LDGLASLPDVNTFRFTRQHPHKSQRWILTLSTPLALISLCKIADAAGRIGPSTGRYLPRALLLSLAGRLSFIRLLSQAAFDRLSSILSRMPF